MSKSNLLTIQLSTQALEKLIGDDPEFVLSIRQAAVAEFARRKLHNYLDKECKDLLDKAVEDYVFIPGKRSLRTEIIHSICDEVEKYKSQIKDLVDELIAMRVNELLNKSTVEKTVDLKVEQLVNKNISYIINTKVDEKLKAIREAALK